MSIERKTKKKSTQTGLTGFQSPSWLEREQTLTYKTNKGVACRSSPRQEVKKWLWVRRWEQVQLLLRFHCRGHHTLRTPPLGLWVASAALSGFQALAGFQKCLLKVNTSFRENMIITNTDMCYLLRSLPKSVKPMTAKWNETLPLLIFVFYKEKIRNKERGGCVGKPGRRQRRAKVFLLSPIYIVKCDHFIYTVCLKHI